MKRTANVKQAIVTASSENKNVSSTGRFVGNHDRIFGLSSLFGKSAVMYVIFTLIYNHLDEHKS